MPLIGRFLLSAGVVVLLLGSPAGAVDDAGAELPSLETGVEIVVPLPGAGGGTSGGGGASSVYCIWSLSRVSGTSPYIVVRDPIEGQLYWYTCFRDGAVWFSEQRPFGAGTAEPVVSARDLALSARDRVPLPPLTLNLSPADRTLQVVGVESWFWAGSSSTSTTEATAALGPFNSTVTARALELRIDPGDGTPELVCAGGGTPYSPGAAADSACVHEWTLDGTFTLTAEVVWEVGFTSNLPGGGASGTLPDLVTTTTVEVVVREALPVIRDPH